MHPFQGQPVRRESGQVADEVFGTIPSARVVVLSPFTNLESRMDLKDLRRSYQEGRLAREDLASEPMSQFQAWFDQAQQAPSAPWFEANAMTLSTADARGRVTARIVLLKHVMDSGFVFFTNYQSEKAEQLEQNPLASLVFYWPHVERQVRIEGAVAKTDAALSSQYFHARPRGSQLSAAASPQSKAVDSRESLVDMTMSLAEKFEGQEIPCPEFWGGYVLQPERVEFWQGRPSRLHDRFTYQRLDDGDEWKITRLAP